jgi:hypothetical protein
MYRGCCRRNIPYFRRRFLRLIYTEVTKASVSEAERLRKSLCEKNVVFLRFCVLYLFYVRSCRHTAQVRSKADSQAKPYRGEFAMRSTWKSQDDVYETSASFSYLMYLCHSVINCKLSAGGNITGTLCSS